MRFVICHKGIKREIIGGFAIAGSEDDFKWLFQKIYDQVLFYKSKEEDKNDNFDYGWINIPSNRKEILATEGEVISWEDNRRIIG